MEEDYIWLKLQPGYLQIYLELLTYSVFFSQKNWFLLFSAINSTIQTWPKTEMKQLLKEQLFLIDFLQISLFIKIVAHVVRHFLRQFARKFLLIIIWLFYMCVRPWLKVKKSRSIFWWVVGLVTSLSSYNKKKLFVWNFYYQNTHSHITHTQRNNIYFLESSFCIASEGK